MTDIKIYAVHILSTDTFAFVKTGEKGYYPAPAILTQAHADSYNQQAGHIDSEIEAANICSITGKWGKFHEVLEVLQGY